MAIVLMRQQELLAALTAQNVGGIVLAIEALAAAMSELRDAEIWSNDPDIAVRLSDALLTNEVVAVRINQLRHWSRQRIDRLHELHG